MSETGSGLDTALRDLASYLEQEIEEGHRGEPVPEGVLRELKQAGAKLQEIQARRGAAAAPIETAVPAEPAVPAETSPGLEEIAQRISVCTKCSLHETRTNTVPGQGNPRPEIMFIGEGPGHDEDVQGLAFVGRAGQLLTKMIEAMGFARDEVFIGNIVKCRPPENRKPMPDEMETCMPFLREQIAVLQPKVIVALGATAVQGLLDVTTGITKLRGTWMTFEGIDVMPTFHPAYLLRTQKAKRPAWDDLQEVLNRLGRKPPPIKKRH